MSTTANLDDDAIARAGLGHSGMSLPAHGRGSMDVGAHGKHDMVAAQHNLDAVSSSDDSDWPDKPTEEELRTLRRVSGKIKWTMWTIAFVELCERFSYYGSAVLYTNFVRGPLPEGSNTGAPLTPDGLPGALGMGPQAAQGISLFNQFFAYVMPLLG